jgi:hypothetical protein
MKNTVPKICTIAHCIDEHFKFKLINTQKIHEFGIGTTIIFYGLWKGWTNFHWLNVEIIGLMRVNETLKPCEKNHGKGHFLEINDRKLKLSEAYTMVLNPKARAFSLRVKFFCGNKCSSIPRSSAIQISLFHSNGTKTDLDKIKFKAVAKPGRTVLRREEYVQQCLNCGYMNTCFKCGELILIPFA